MGARYIRMDGERTLIVIFCTRIPIHTCSLVSSLLLCFGKDIYYFCLQVVQKLKKKKTTIREMNFNLTF